MNAQGAGEGNDPSQASKKRRTDENGEREEEIYIILNVGGTKFSTSKTTLLTEPNSMLGVMFSGKYPLAPSPADGRYTFYIIFIFRP